MAERSKIEWCDATFNPWIGCTKVSPACDNCYAERGFDLRRRVVQWGAGQARKRTSAENWKHPGRWNKKPFYECASCGTRSHGKAYMDAGPNMGITDTGQECPACGSRDMEPARMRVFCASLADVFDKEVPAQWRIELLSLILATPNLDWLLLTKRIGNAADMLERAFRAVHHGREGWADNVPRNVWLGATICNQAEADRDIPKLLKAPAAVRFLSVEPMLGDIELTGHEYSVAPGLEEGIDWLTGKTSQASNIFGGDAAPWRSRDCYDFPHDAEEPRIHWVISGGESGPHARPMHPAWARSLRDQCAAARVAFLHKQNGEWVEKQQADMIGDFSDVLRGSDGSKVITRHGAIFYRVGKKAAGRLLDGVEHNGFPEVSK